MLAKRNIFHNKVEITNISNNIIPSFTQNTPYLRLEIFMEDFRTLPRKAPPPPIHPLLELLIENWYNYGSYSSFNWTMCVSCKGSFVLVRMRYRFHMGS